MLHGSACGTILYFLRSGAEHVAPVENAIDTYLLEQRDRQMTYSKAKGQTDDIQMTYSKAKGQTDDIQQSKGTDR